MRETHSLSIKKTRRQRRGSHSVCLPRSFLERQPIGSHACRCSGLIDGKWYNMLVKQESEREACMLLGNERIFWRENESKAGALSLSLIRIESRGRAQAARQCQGSIHTSASRLSSTTTLKTLTSVTRESSFNFLSPPDPLSLGFIIFRRTVCTRCTAAAAAGKEKRCDEYAFPWKKSDSRFVISGSLFSLSPLVLSSSLLSLVCFLSRFSVWDWECVVPLPTLGSRSRSRNCDNRSSHLAACIDETSGARSDDARS